MSETMIMMKMTSLFLLLLSAGASAKTYSYSLLADFPSAAGPTESYGGLIIDDAGNLYGTSMGGGANNFGMVFKVTSKGTLSTLYSFTGGSGGEGPSGTLTRDNEGNLYGILTGINAFGPNGFSAVFKVTTKGKETTLYEFPSGNYVFGSGVALDADGNLYGYANNNTNYYGSVFKLTPAGVFSTLYNFCSLSGCVDGWSPQGSLIIDRVGNLYGVTAVGGQFDNGTVFKLTPEGAETVLHSFTAAYGFINSDGAGPVSKLAQDADGNLYGTAAGGGVSGFGTAFKIFTDGSESTLYSFSGGADGGYPLALSRDSAGDLYGTTNFGGNGCCEGEFVKQPDCYPCYSGYGVIFKLTLAQKESVLYTVPALTGSNAPQGPEGAGAGLVMDKAGNLYGVAPYGGPEGLGAVYKLTKRN